MRGCRGLLVIGILFAWVSAGLAQVTTGMISGSVSDSSGAVLPGAKVVVLNEETGISRSATTDAAGRYSAPSLGLGRYRVTVSQEGFQTEVRTGIEITVGRNAVVDVAMTVGAVTQTVEVTGEAPLIETTKSSVDYLVNDATVRELPLNGRDIAQLVLMNPGVYITETPRNNDFNYGYGKLISISGFRPEDNLFLLDGTDAGDYRNRVPAAPSGSMFGAETVREFQVKTSTFSANYGHSIGGVMNAVTKSGTNSLHGDAYEFLRNSALDARKFFDPGSVPPFKQNQFGVTLGGPIRRDKTFFFLGYEALRRRRSETVINNVPDESVHLLTTVNPRTKPYLDLYPLPTPGAQRFPSTRTAQYIFQDPQKDTEDFGLARIDHQFSSNDSLFGRITIQQAERILNDGFPPPDFNAVGFMRTRFFTLSETHIFSPRSLNTFRVAVNRVAPGQSSTYATWPAGLLSVQNQPYPPIISVTGLTTLGGDKAPNTYAITNRFEYIDDVTLERGNHSIQFGASLQHFRFNENQPERPMGQWSFSSLTNFLAAVSNRYRGTPDIFGNFIRGWRQNFFGLYIQDDWRITPRLTLNLGLRWDPITVAKEVNGLVANLRHLTDAIPTVGDPYWKNRSMRDYGPRIGFAWNPFANGKTSVRGGFGIYYSRVDTNMYWTPAARDGYFSPSYSTTDARYLALFPSATALVQTAIQSGSFRGSAFPITSENMQTPSGYQWNLTTQRQFGGNTVLSLAYVGNRGINLTSYSDFNTPKAVFLGEGLRVPDGATATNPNFDQINYVGSNMNSWYNAFQTSLLRKMGAGLQFQLNYTFSKTLSEGETTQSAGPYTDGGSVFYAHDPHVLKGHGAIDVPQLFTGNYVYQLPFGSGQRWLNQGGVMNKVIGGWELKGIVTMKSGQPFSVTVDGVGGALGALMAGKRPNAIAGVKPKTYGGPNQADQYFIPSDFRYPSDPRAIGNLGRQTMRGPGIVTFDLGLTKDLAVTERIKMQFRAEAFNLANRANFANPSVSAYDNRGTARSDAGVITETTTHPREIQFGLKLLF